MERIKINNIEKKGVVCIVKYCAQGCHPNEIREATLNVNFNAQEIDYLEKDVGIGGTVEVEIKSDKPNPRGGFYVNITSVDMTSAVKGEPTPNRPLMKGEEGFKEEQKCRTPTEMTANNLTEIYFKNNLASEPQIVIDAYRFFVLELEQNG